MREIDDLEEFSDLLKYKKTRFVRENPNQRANTLAHLKKISDKHRQISKRRKPQRGVSISAEDFNNGSPKLGDMIARNPKNHDDQWLIAEQYFNDNFEQVN